MPEHSELQDRVKPFPTATAKAIIEDELAASGTGTISSVFRKISAEPVAAASIGQVLEAYTAHPTPHTPHPAPPVSEAKS